MPTKIVEGWDDQNSYLQ